MVFKFHRWLPWCVILVSGVVLSVAGINSENQNETSTSQFTTNSAILPTIQTVISSSSTPDAAVQTDTPASVVIGYPPQDININKSIGSRFRGEHNSVSQTSSDKSVSDSSVHAVAKDNEKNVGNTPLNSLTSPVTTALPVIPVTTKSSVTDISATIPLSTTQPTLQLIHSGLLPTTTETNTKIIETQNTTETRAEISTTTKHFIPTTQNPTSDFYVKTTPTISVNTVPDNNTAQSSTTPKAKVYDRRPTVSHRPIGGKIITTDKYIPSTKPTPKNTTSQFTNKTGVTVTHDTNGKPPTQVVKPVSVDTTSKVFASVVPPTTVDKSNIIYDTNLTTAASDAIDTLLPFRKLPEWEEAKVSWGWAWEFHVYATGVLFSFVAAINFICCLRLHCFQKLPGRGYFFALNIILLVLGMARAGSYFEDAYNLVGILPTSLAFFLFDIGFACLTSAFAVLFLALLQATKVSVLPGSMQRPPALASVIMFHCCITVMADVLAGEIGVRLKFLIVLVHAFSVGWLFCLTVTYFWAFRLLYVAALRKQGEIIRFTFTKLHIEGAPLPPRIPNPSLALAVRVVLVAACLGFVHCFVQLLGLLGVYRICGIHFPLPWGWWIYQSVNRCLEFLVATALTYVATQPLHHNDLLASQESCCSLGSVLSCCTCMTSSLSTDDIYPTYCASNAAVARTNFTFERWESANSAVANNDVYPGNGQLATVQGLGLSFTPGRPDLNNVSTLSSAPVGCAHSSSSLINKSEFRSLGNRPQFTRATLATLSDFHNARSARPPASMLLSDNGFIRFRANGDLEHTVITDEGTYVGRKDIVGNVRSVDGSIKPAGNCTPILQGVLKDYHTYRVSGGSIDTDMSSPDHVGTGNARHMCLHRHGSACSSESAGASFDVHFYLNPPAMTKTQELCRRRSANSTPCKEVGVQSDRVVGVRPAAPPNLNLPSSPAMMAPNNGQQSQDITPDSAIFLEMPTTDDESNKEGGILIRNFPGSEEEHDFTFSQSLNDLHCNTSNSSNGVTPRHRHRSRSLLARLKGSSFSLTSHHGYEPLESRVQSQSTLGGKGRMRRTSSEDPLRSQHPSHPTYKDFKQWEMRTVFRGSGASSRMSRDHHRDSFYNSEVSMTTGSREMVMYVDTEVQTEPMEFIPAPVTQTPVAQPPIPHQESVV